MGSRLRKLAESGPTQGLIGVHIQTQCGLIASSELTKVTLNQNGWRHRSGKEALRSEVQAVPQRRKGWQTRRRAQPPRSFRQKDRPRRRLQLHRRQQVKGNHVGLGHVRDLLDESQKIHSRNQDGVCRFEEEEGQGQPDRLSQGLYFIIDLKISRHTTIKKNILSVFE